MRASAPYRQRPRSRDDLWARRAMPYPITACAPEAPLDGPALSDLDAKLMLESRLEPLTVENWEKSFYASPVDFGGGVPGYHVR